MLFDWLLECLEKFRAGRRSGMTLVEPGVGRRRGEDMPMLSTLYEDRICKAAIRVADTIITQMKFGVGVQ